MRASGFELPVPEDPGALSLKPGAYPLLTPNFSS
jgi:hypothetical protein